MSESEWGVARVMRPRGSRARIVSPLVALYVLIQGACIYENAANNLALRDSALLHSEAMVQKGLPQLSRHRMRSLQIQRVNLRDEDLVRISRFKKLEYLLLNGCNINDADLRHLRNLTKLERLRVSSNEITDDGLRQFENLTQLKELSLTSRQVRGDGLKWLPNVAPITGLDLIGCAISDDAIGNIRRFQNLQSLALRHTEVTDAGLMRATKNYWLLNVIPSDHCTLEGVRSFRKALLDGRRKARQQGLDVPPDDTLFIDVEDPALRGSPPPPGYPKNRTPLPGRDTTGRVGP